MPLSASPEGMKGVQKQQKPTHGKSSSQQQKHQFVRRQISQSKVPETMKKETEALQRKAPPSADVRCGARRLVQLEKVPLLNKTFTAVNTSVSSSEFRQRCRDGTFRSPTPICRRPHHRSNSIDSDLSDFGPDVVFGVLTQQNRTKSRERNQWNFSWKMPKSSNSGVSNGTCKNSKLPCGAASSMEMSAKLPQLNGFCPGRTSCQLQHFSRSHFELIKYKRTLNS